MENKEFYWQLYLIILSLAAISMTYWAIFKPPPGYDCTLRTIENEVLTGNCSFLYDKAKNKIDISEYILSDIDITTTTTLEHSYLIGAYLEVDVITTPETTTTATTSTTSTYKLKHQGNLSSNIKQTTSTTQTTLKIVFDYMQTCERNTDCTIVYGCCPNSNPTPINVNYTKYYRIFLKCPIRTQCGMMVKPPYKAVCNNQKCEKLLE